jgi:putative porin
VAPGAAASQQDVQALRDLVEAQQKQIQEQGQQVQQLREQLHQVLDALQQSNANAQQLQSGAEQAQSTAAQAQQAASQAQIAADAASTSAASVLTATTALQRSDNNQRTQITAMQNILGRFRLSGDVRLRGDTFMQDGTQDRNRARLRIRLGLDGQLNEDFVGSVALATGALGNGSSTNETLTGAFDRKTIGLDRGFITYNPVAHSWLSLTGGKFPYLWQRTSVTGDPDINPEGFDQKVSFNFNGVVKNFTAQAIQLLYNESSTGQDSYVLGAQAQVRLAAGPWSTTASFLNQHWNRPDALLQASAFTVGATTTGGTVMVGTNAPVTVSFPVPGEGPGCAANGNLPKVAPCAFAPYGMTNATYIDANKVPHFLSGFDIADVILNNQLQTGNSRLPVNLVLEFEENLDAAHHPLSAAKGNPVLSNLGSQNKAYGGDISLGQTVRRNDMQFGYSWYRQEQDAVLASLADSEQRAPTNVLQNRVYASWRLRSNTLATFTWWRGRTLNTWLENNEALYNNTNWGGSVVNGVIAGKSTISTLGQREPWLNFYQFDLLYTF